MDNRKSDYHGNRYMRESKSIGINRIKEAKGNAQLCLLDTHTSIELPLSPTSQDGIAIEHAMNQSIHRSSS